MMPKISHKSAGFEDGGKGCKPKDGRNEDLEAGIVKETDFPLEPL